MPEIKVNIDEETGRALKVLAVLNGRSYSKFIPMYLATCIRNNLISVDPVTRELVPSATVPTTAPTTYQIAPAQPSVTVPAPATYQTVPAQPSVTAPNLVPNPEAVQELKNMGVAAIKFNKSDTLTDPLKIKSKELTNELKELSINQKKEKLLYKDFVDMIVPYVRANYSDYTEQPTETQLKYLFNAFKTSLEFDEKDLNDFAHEYEDSEERLNLLNTDPIAYIKKYDLESGGYLSDMIDITFYVEPEEEFQPYYDIYIKDRIEAREPYLLIPMDTNEIYQKVKKYVMAHADRSKECEAFMNVMEYSYAFGHNHDEAYEHYKRENNPHRDNLFGYNVTADLIYAAMGTPTDGSYKYSDEEMSEIATALAWYQPLDMPDIK